MKWIVLKEDSGKIVLVSKNEYNEETGLVPLGSYLTVEENNRKFILRVDKSFQYSPYEPSPMIIDLDLHALLQDQNTRNIVYATRIMEIPTRMDGLSSFIKPQTVARLATQEEINHALEITEGMPVFMASAYGKNSNILRDYNGNFVVVNIPEDAFFYQIMITGKTGSGKTVAMKYMAHYFTNHEFKYFDDSPGTVLAVNVKGEDLLRMDQPSSETVIDQNILQEWNTLKIKPEGVSTFKIYYPGNAISTYSKTVNREKCEKITLKTENINPEALTGLVQNLSEQAIDYLPGIFRYWQKEYRKEGQILKNFIEYLNEYGYKNIKIMDEREIVNTIDLHSGTFNNIIRVLTKNSTYFDIPGAKELDADDILQPGKMSVIDVSDKSGIGFGSVLLRDILEKIYNVKSRRENNIPVLIMIDEVHEFYGDIRSREALATIDAITRKGRAFGIGVIFASQNPEDMPKGINSVVNTKIHFRSDSKNLDIKDSEIDPEALDVGYALSRIYGLNDVKFIKFPLSPGGVFNG